MKKKRFVFGAGLWLGLCALLFTGCADNRNGQSAVKESAQAPPVIKAAALKGPTAIGMVYLMDQAKQQKTAGQYDFTIAAAADEFSAALLQGDLQIAALPCNAAAALYNKSGGKIKVLAINTLGVLYLLENGTTIHSVADLKGKTIYTTGKGTTPEYTLRFLLKSAGLDPDRDVRIEFMSEAAEAAVRLAQQSSSAVAMLPQPYAATVMMNNSEVRIALDVTKEWENLTQSDSTVVTGVIAVNAAYYEQNRAAVAEWMRAYRASVEYVLGNPSAAAQLVSDFGIFSSAVAAQAIPYCNITYIDGAGMKHKINAYLQVLYDENPAAVGGRMPDDGFYGGQP